MDNREGSTTTPNIFSTISTALARSLRAHREARRLSLGELATQSGVSKTTLSKIETGLANPSVETLWRIAEALGLPLGTLLGEAEPPRSRVIRADEGAWVESQSGLLGRLIITEGRNHRTEVFEIMLDPGADYYADPHSPGTEELLLCTEGVIQVGPVGQETDLAAGDAFWFPADLPHRYRSVLGARGVLVMSYSPTPVPCG